jgi:uncharacterized linocin/CFP29 family protein
MFAKHPLEHVKEKLSESDLLDALRLAIIAELDAVSFYLQIAARSPREDVRKVFEDVANEEKTHVGEFLELLKRLDPRQAEELAKGRMEVLEIIGGKNGGGGAVATTGSSGENSGSSVSIESAVARLFRETANASRVLRRYLPVTIVGPGVDYVAATSVGYGEEGVTVVSESIVPLRDVVVEFTVPEKVVERSLRFNGSLEPIVDYAARKFVVAEEKIVVSQLVEAKGVLEKNIGAWDKPGEAVDDVAKAVSMLEAEGFNGPFTLLVPVQRYARLLAVYEKTGVMELSRLEKLVKVVRTPLLHENTVVLLAAQSTVADIVVSVDTRVDYLGLETSGHRFKAWETIALRISNPRGIVLMRQG